MHRCVVHGARSVEVSMNRYEYFIDKYLVPIYKHDGLRGVLLFLIAVALLVGAAFYFGLGEIVMRLLGE